jgi:hypothetical protein
VPYLGFDGYFTVKMEALRSTETSVIINYTKLRTEDLTLQELYYDGKGEGKAISLQAWTDPEGFRRLRPSDFKTFGL